MTATMPLNVNFKKELGVILKIIRKFLKKQDKSKPEFKDTEDKDVYRLNIDRAWGAQINVNYLLTECRRLFPGHEEESHNKQKTLCIIYDLRDNHKILISYIESTKPLISDVGIADNEETKLDFTLKAEYVDEVVDRIAVPIWFIHRLDRTIFKPITTAILVLMFRPPLFHIKTSKK
jgi:hypothetical protein